MQKMLKENIWTDVNVRNGEEENVRSSVRPTEILKLNPCYPFIVCGSSLKRRVKKLQVPSLLNCKKPKSFFENIIE